MVKLDTTVSIRFKVFAIENGYTISGLLNQIVVDFLNRNGVLPENPSQRNENTIGEKQHEKHSENK